MGIQGKSLYTSKAAERLQQLTKSPYDLTADKALGVERLRDYICHSEQFSLHYAMQQIDDDVIDALQALADECALVEKFSAMKRGDVINCIDGFASENRKVLHTACRDLFDKDPRETGATEQAKKEIAKLEAFLTELNNGELCNDRGEPFHTMIHLGIGGSDLGPRSIYEALRNHAKEDRKVFFISNVDPDDAAAVLSQVSLERTLVNIVSKSGTTLETLTNEELVKSAFVGAGLDPAHHFIAVTGEGSPMDDPEKYLRSFYMYDYIGGRFSSTSMVGLVMLGFAFGMTKVWEFLKGAAVVDREAEELNIRNNLPLLLALLGVWNHNFLHYSSIAILPYSQALHRFPAHLQQCDMESNGKSTSRDGKRVTYSTGPIVWGEPGTNGQHAFYQLLHQGTEIVPVEFIGFRKSQLAMDRTIKNTSSQQKLLANLLAQSIALATGKESDNPNKQFDGNRPNSVLLADELTPEAMGALLALYEAKIVFQGFVWNINSFDQEGVQLGKVLANRILGLISGDEKGEDSLERILLQEAKLL